MKKRFLASCLALVIAISVLSGCTPAEKDSSGNGSDKVTVSISFWEPSTNREMETSLKQITASYTALHPNVEFDLQSQPVAGYQDWLKARIAADEAPTIQENHAGILGDQFKRGYIMDIKEEFGKPNPYANNTIWKDIFQDGRLDVAHEYSYDPTYAVPFSGMGIAYFYNKDLYEKLSLKEPDTWQEFMANCEVIKGEKINPVAMMLMKRDAVMWFSWYVSTGLFANYYLANPDINPNGDLVVHDKELTRAIKDGKFDYTKGMEEKAFNKFLDIAEQLGKYAEGATGLDEAGAKAQFLGGKAAHIMSGSWDKKAFTENQSFKVGVFKLPAFTTEDSEYASSNMRTTAAQVFGITKSANKSKAETDAGADFLKYFTAPDNYKIFVESTFSIPVIKDMKIDAMYDAFLGGSNNTLEVFAKGGPTSAANCTIATSMAMSGKPYDRKKLLSELQTAADEFADMIIEKNEVNAANNYGVDEIPVQGKFAPTKP